MQGDPGVVPGWIRPIYRLPTGVSRASGHPSCRALTDISAKPRPWQGSGHSRWKYRIGDGRAQRMLRSLVLAPILALAACAPATTEPTAEASTPVTGQLTVTSASFEEGTAIPRQYTCDGADVSPPLAWSGAPEGTVAFALVVDDPDARGWVHWLVADLPGDATSLAEGSAGGGVEGTHRLRAGRLGRAMPAIGDAHVRLRALRALRACSACKEASAPMSSAPRWRARCSRPGA